MAHFYKFATPNLAVLFSKTTQSEEWTAWPGIGMEKSLPLSRKVAPCIYINRSPTINSAKRSRFQKEPLRWLSLQTRQNLPYHQTTVSTFIRYDERSLSRRS
jgi:hypothetical protein